MCRWALDGLGNWRRTTHTPVGGAETTEVRQHNKLHQITKAGSEELSYDTTGNMTDDGTRTFEYDAFNRIKTVTKKSGSVLLATYAYDAFGRRVSKTVSNNGLSGTIPNGRTDYIYSGWQCVEERDEADNVTRQYVWGLYVDELIQQRDNPDDSSAADYYPLQDLLYRTAALTDDGGNVVEAYDTDAYGRTLIFDSPGSDSTWFTDYDTTTDTPMCEFIFTGRRYDPESRLYHYRARTYNPTLGRFLQRDPLMYIDGMSMYEYVMSNPQAYLDPFGLEKCLTKEECEELRKEAIDAIRKARDARDSFWDVKWQSKVQQEISNWSYREEQKVKEAEKHANNIRKHFDIIFDKQDSNLRIIDEAPDDLVSTGIKDGVTNIVTTTIFHFIRKAGNIWLDIAQVAIDLLEVPTRQYVMYARNEKLGAHGRRVAMFASEAIQKARALRDAYEKELKRRNKALDDKIKGHKQKWKQYQNKVKQLRKKWEKNNCWEKTGSSIPYV